MAVFFPKLIHACFFSCPPVDAVKPFAIRRGIEVLEILSAGVIYFDWHGERRTFLPGTIFWHRAGEKTICETDPGNPYRCYALHFEAGRHMCPAPRISQWNPPGESIGFARQCLRAFHAGIGDADYLSQYVYSTFRWRCTTENPYSFERSPGLTRALTYMERYLEEPLTLQMVATHAGISIPYLFFLFQRQFQMTPAHYLRRLRIGKAKSLLAGNTTPIKEIMALCGYDSPTVFYRQFQAETSMTPAKYRMKYYTYPLDPVSQSTP